MYLEPSVGVHLGHPRWGLGDRVVTPQSCRAYASVLISPQLRAAPGGLNCQIPPALLSAPHVQAKQALATTGEEGISGSLVTGPHWSTRVSAVTLAPLSSAHISHWVHFSHSSGGCWSRCVGEEGW